MSVKTQRSRRRRLAARAAMPSLLAALATALLWSAPAPAATGDVGIPGPSSSGAGSAPTGEKPESKLWWNDGRWWASMYDVASGTYHIWWLNPSTSPETWVDSGTAIDNRPKSRADTLWDGSHLYVASAPFASSNTSGVTGSPARLYRFSYNALSRTYSLDAGFPVSINNISSETITLDKDSTGRLWATWAQGGSVYFNATTNGDASWGTPAVLPADNATGLDADDISTVIAFGAGRVGIMWSNQVASTTYFAVHNDGDPVGTWQPSEGVTIPGPGQSDDHVNVKDLQSDSSGRIFAVIKTSLTDLAGVSSSAPVIVVLARGARGGWSRATFGTVANCHTRPILVLDSSNNLAHVYATAPDSGCPYSGSPGTIFEKTSSLGNLSFPSGRGTPVMRIEGSPNLNNATATKQTVNNSTGIVLLASDDVRKQYWSSYQPLAGSAPSPPTASFTTSPTSGTAPLAVQFTDTSTSSPTSWSWDFGDGGTSAVQNPSHTYAAAGTYTAKLVASNGAGASAPASATITVGSPPPPGAISVVGSQESQSTAAVSAVTLGRPAGVSAGDLLVAGFSVDNNPGITAPAGWTQITSLQPNTGVTVAAYYRVVGSGETVIADSWATSTAEKYGGGMTAYRGVSASHPFDVATPSTTVATTHVSSVTAPSVTTVTDGALLIGGLGADGATSITTPPTGWTEGYDSVGAQMSEQASRSQSTAGASGSATWKMSDSRRAAVWMTALRPG
jgi:PKD repeat protein